MLKRNKILIVCVVFFLLLIGGAYVKVEILTMIHGSEFSELYDKSGWVNDITYLKVYDYSKTKAKVYYANLGHKKDGIGNATYMYYFYKKNSEWELEKWECTWSQNGNADEFVWPYYFH